MRRILGKTMTDLDLDHTFVTSDFHFRDWKYHPSFLHESTEEMESEHIALWNSVVGKDSLVLYVGDFCEHELLRGNGCMTDLAELIGKLNGRIVLIKGNHDKLDDAFYRMAFVDVVDRMYIDDLKLLLIHDPAEGRLRPGDRMIYGHLHRMREASPPTTRNSICVCAKWHGWKPISLAEAFRQMDAADA